MKQVIITSENEWKTKRQIMSEMNIGFTTYKKRLKQLTSSRAYSALTQVVKVKINPVSKRKTPTRLVHSSVITKFFSRQRLKLTETRKLKIWAQNQKWDIRIHAMPESIMGHEMKAKVEFLVSQLRQVYNQRIKGFYCIEPNPMPSVRPYVHAHILLSGKNLCPKVLKCQLETIMTSNYQRRLKMDVYDYSFGQSGVDYLFKDPSQRFFKV